MCALNDNAPALGHGQRPTTEPAGSQQDFATALAQLQEALAKRRVEPICAGYIALRRCAAGMPVKALVEKVHSAVGEPGLAILISAFAHRGCFMCEGGASPCLTCEGTGVVHGGRVCPDCEGQGIETCSFCQGTGWSDSDQMPPELRPAIIRKQLFHIDKETARLAAMSGPKMPDPATLAPAQRREISTFLLRLHEQLLYLSHNQVTDGNGLANRIQAVAARTQEVNEAWRVKLLAAMPGAMPA